MVSQFAQFFNMQPTMIRLKDPVDSEISFIMVPVNNMQSMKEINVKFMKTPIKSICIDKERGGGSTMQDDVWSKASREHSTMLASQGWQ